MQLKLTKAQKIIVTGAAGFIGSHTVEQLLAAGHHVWGVDDFRTGREFNLANAKGNPSFVFCEGDITTTDFFAALVKTVRPDGIIHLAGLVSVPESIANPALNDRLNFLATKMVADAAEVEKVSRLVFSSSAAVYGDPDNLPLIENSEKKPFSPYGQAKLASEALLLNKRAFSAICLRYFNVYGPRQDPSSPYSGVITKFSECLRKKNRPKIYGDGNQTRDFICVRDVARANVIAVTQSTVSGSFNICTGQPTSINELWRVMRSGNSQALDPIYAKQRSGDIVYSHGSPEMARQCLNFIPNINLSEGLAEYKKWLGC